MRHCFSLRNPAKFLVFAVLAALISQGCVKPAPERPEIQQDAMKTMVLTNPWTAAGFEAGPIAGNWLASFNDPELAILVTEAVANNPICASVLHVSSRPRNMSTWQKPLCGRPSVFWARGASKAAMTVIWV